VSGTHVRRRGPGSRADEHHPTRRELVDFAAIVSKRDGLAELGRESVRSSFALANIRQSIFDEIDSVDLS
jgi:hypothetical protein